MHHNQTSKPHSTLFLLFLCLTSMPSNSLGASAELSDNVPHQEKAAMRISIRPTEPHTTAHECITFLQSCVKALPQNKALEHFSQTLGNGNGHTKTTKEVIKELSKLIDTVTDVLHRSAESGNTHIMKLLLQAGARLDARNDAGLTPLHVAAAHGQIDAARVLVDTGADINVQSFFLGTPLHAAARNGQSALARFLLSAGADKEAPDRDKQTPLHAAAADGHVETTKIFLDAGADANASSFCTGTPLHAAIRNGHIRTVQMLITHGAQVDSVVPSIEQTALHLSLETGHIEIAHYLISSDADVNSPDNMALQTPLHLAAALCHMPLVRALIGDGADVNTQDRHKRTPCHAAALSGQPTAQEVIRFLVSTGAVFDMLDAKGKTPLEYLASY